MTFSIWCCNYAVFALCITVASQYTLEELGIHNAQTEIGLNITEILNDIFSHGYDKRVRPNYAGPPVEVGVSMYIISISSVSEVQMDFTADFYFRQAWRDPRLAFEPRPSIDALFVGAEIADKIWNPDTFFANEKSAQFHIATTPNTFIRLTSMGDVLRSTRLTVTSSCAMNLQYFPMDKQLCTIEVESYGYSMADIMYKWGKGKDSVGMSTEVQLPQFKVQGLQQKSKVEVLVTGNYSRLVCELEFVRSMGYYLIQIYIPASLIVIISWVSFWLHRNASPARVQLGVMTVLTMTTLMSSTNAALPKISYVKSIDVFLGTCFVMVFATLLEYATVGYLGKRIAMRKRQQSQQASAIAKANRTLQRTEIENENGAAQQAIGFARENIYAQRNAAAEIRYRLIGMNTTTEGTSQQQQQQQDPARQAVVNKIQRSIDLTKKRISFVESSSNAEEGESPEGSAPGPAFHGNKNKNTLFGIEPSDIDKYSRVVFPVCFLCFNLMYWIIYMHISEFLAEFENVE